jgi:hypothetical protein
MRLKLQKGSCTAAERSAQIEPPMNDCSLLVPVTKHSSPAEFSKQRMLNTRKFDWIGGRSLLRISVASWMNSSSVRPAARSYLGFSTGVSAPLSALPRHRAMPPKVEAAALKPSTRVILAASVPHRLPLSVARPLTFFAHTPPARARPLTFAHARAAVVPAERTLNISKQRAMGQQPRACLKRAVTRILARRVPYT